VQLHSAYARNDLVIKEPSINVQVVLVSAQIHDALESGYIPQVLGQTLYDLGLPFENLATRDFQRKPFRTIHFREFLQFPGFWRPRYRKRVTAQVPRVKVAFHRPDADYFARGLSNLAERDELPRGSQPGFFGKLSFGGCQGILVVAVLALGNGPRSFIFVLPEGASRMRQEHFDPGYGSAEQENARTPFELGLGHAGSLADIRSIREAP